MEDHQVREPLDHQWSLERSFISSSVNSAISLEFMTHLDAVGIPRAPSSNYMGSCVLVDETKATRVFIQKLTYVLLLVSRWIVLLIFSDSDQCPAKRLLLQNRTCFALAQQY